MNLLFSIFIHAKPLAKLFLTTSVNSSIIFLEYLAPVFTRIPATYSTSLKALNDRGLYLQKATLEGETYEVLYTQIKHQSYARATGRIAQVLDEISPDSVKQFKISNINAGTGADNVIPGVLDLLFNFRYCI